MIEVGPSIESSRIPTDRNIVHSYRFRPDLQAFTLFDPSFGWHSSQQAALSVAASKSVVVSTDISDFYPRLYHHRIHNAVDAATANKQAVRRIGILLSALAEGGVSYGLPIGGNAARLLAESVLDRTDRLLLNRGIQFCRFVDDYYLFADSDEEGRQALVVLSEALLMHEGLTLSRIKTRIMSTEEFRNISPAADPGTADAKPEEEARSFLRIRLKYDPYSPTATEDYDRLVEEIGRFDIVGMLTRELTKSRIDEPLTRQLIKSLRYLDKDVRADAVESLIDNLHVLFPVFPTVAIVLKAVKDEIDPDVRAKLFKTIRDLIATRSHIFQVGVNLSFAVRLLAHDPSDESEVLLARSYDNSPSIAVRRDIILAMAVRGARHWIADQLRRSTTLTSWEQRALIPASYILRDEGLHWRRKYRVATPVESSFMAWVGEKNNGGTWVIPL